MQQSEIKALLPKVLELVIAAGKIISEHSKRDVQIFHKGPVDLVTETDLAVEAYLLEEFEKLLPGVAFMGEEGEAKGQKSNLNGLTWIVDPVDGTTNYAHNVPFVATSVALWSGTEVLLGVINCPLLGECFWAGRGLGAFGGKEEQGKITQTKPLKVSGAAQLSQALLASGFPYDFADNLPVILRRLGKVLPLTQGMRRCGAAAIDMAYVAAGKFDAYYEEGIKPWDVAAGWLLVQEAGGKVSDLHGGAYELLKKGIIASNGLVHEQLLEVLKD